MTPETWKWFWHKEKKVKKKKFLKHQIIFFFHLFYCSSKFSLVPRLTPILQFFSFLISIILFTVYNTFYSILLLNDARDITNFTIYILQISMSPITKKITNIYSLYCLNNTNHIFTTSICKLFIVSFIVWIGYLKKFIFNNKKYIYFLIIFLFILLLLSINIF